MFRLLALVYISYAFDILRAPSFYLRGVTTRTQRKAPCLAGSGDNDPGAGGEGETMGEIEKKFVDLERSLTVAVEEERYTDAADARDRLFRMQMDEISSVINTNSNFYRAFSEKDMASMSSVWLDSESVSCVHPGQTPLIGHKNVMRTWKIMLASTDSRFKSNTISPTNMFVSVKGESAWVSCTEEVTMPLPGMAPRRLLATNVFRKLNNRWYLVHHHASPCSTTQIGGGQANVQIGSSQGQGIVSPQGIVSLIKNALQKRATGASFAIQPKLQISSSSSSTADKVAEVLGDMLMGGENSESRDSEGDQDDDAESHGASKAEETEQPNREQVILRFVDDDGSPYPLGWSRDTYSQRIIELTPGGQAANNGVQPGWVLTKIGDVPVRTDLEYKIAINVTKSAGKAEACFEFDTADTAQTMPSIPSSSLSSSAAPISPPSSSALVGIGEEKVIATVAEADTAGTSGFGGKKEEDLEDNPSREVLRTLRRLEHEGRISKETKTTLVTDLITKSMDGQKSVIEVAHSLLVDSEDEGDFVDQCNVLAARLTMKES